MDDAGRPCWPPWRVRWCSLGTLCKFVEEGGECPQRDSCKFAHTVRVLPPTALLRADSCPCAP